MIDKFEDFLINAVSDSRSVDFVRVKAQTKSGFGFNLSSTQCSSVYYYHMQRDQTLSLGDYYLLSFTDSTRCEGRLDVINAVKVEAYADFMLSLWDNDNTKTLLIKHLFDSSVFNHWIKQQLISELPDTSIKLIEFLQPIPPSVINAIAEYIPTKLLPGCIEYCGSRSMVTTFLVEEGLPESSELTFNVTQYCQKNNLVTCLYLIELLKGGSTAELFDAEVVSTLIKEMLTLKIPVSASFVKQLISLNPHVYKQLCNVVFEQPQLKIMVLTEAIMLPESPELLADYLVGFSDNLKTAIINNIPLQKLPDCLELKGDNTNIREYLVVYHNVSNTKFHEELKQYCIDNDYHENAFLITLLAKEANETVLPDKQLIELFKDIASYANTVSIIETLIFTNLLIYKKLCNSLSKDSEFESTVIDNVLSRIPKTDGELSSYIEGFSSDIISSIVENVPLEFIPIFLAYDVSENLICSYLVEHCDHVKSQQMGAYIDKYQYNHARLLLSIIEHWQGGLRLDPNLITEQIKKYQRALFATHSIDRTRITPFILSSCNVVRHQYLKPQTCCEGHLYYSAKKEQWSVKCRGNICDKFSSDEQFNQTLFYKLIYKTSNILASQLHQDERFTRSIAALNRWNDLLERLHCLDCNKPLALSEHAKNSMGNMAIGATYWHCNDKGCRQFCNSIKLSYCLGCNKVIDSRNDTQSCKPFEIKSHKKFYICNSCGSCCRDHSGFSGRCAHCGKDKAYANDGKGSYSPKATCKFCDKRVSISPWNFKQLNTLNAEAAKRDNFNKVTSKFVYSSDLVGSNHSALHTIELPWDNKTLYIYDLYETLRKGVITFSMLSQFDNVYDVKIIERIADLGFCHDNYLSKDMSIYSFLTIIETQKENFDVSNVTEAVQQRIGYLFEVMNAQKLWKHYENVEIPFLYALNDLLGDGISIDSREAITLLTKIEKARNVLVEGLRDLGVDTPDNATFADYIQKNYSQQDNRNVMKAINRSDFKLLREINDEFNAMYKITKLERMGSLLQQFSGVERSFIPNYQIMGAETGRCTSRTPNILGFPKELRSLVRARTGHGIVECDYSQMEIGVMAAMSDDEVMIADYNSGDVYQELANSLSLSRENAKIVFLSILYGVGISTLASWLQQSTGQAKEVIEKFYDRYKEVKYFQEQQVEFGDQNGYVSAISGLRRRVNFNALENANNHKKHFLLHWQNNWFKNFPIQASAAIVFKKAIISLAENNRGSGFKLIAPMYDAIVFEAPLSELEQHTRVVEAAMIRAMLEQFPKLKPHIKINNFDTSCWNAGESIKNQNQFIDDIVSTQLIN